MCRKLSVLAGVVALAACEPRPATTVPPAPAFIEPTTEATYVGSAACRRCHQALHDRWQKTRMANVVRDPKDHPEAILPDLAEAARSDPRVTFTAADIAFVYGSRWKQRYFTRRGDDLFPLPMQWDVTHEAWKPYAVAKGTDWWTAFYPEDNLARPTGPLCDGCHSVGYDTASRKVVEWNVGCEKCHGPGSHHAAHPTRRNIYGAARLDDVAATDVCVQCHSQGRPRKPQDDGRAYDWPVGYRVGLALAEFWQLEPHTPGVTSFTHYADGSAHKNRMQGNDFVQSLMYTRGVTCASCHDAHGTENPADLRLPASRLCLRCHEAGGRNGPHEATLAAHTHHKEGSPGSSCVECHMPKTAQTIGDVLLRSHTFRFVPPSTTSSLGVPNACAACHGDRPEGWAARALASWKGMSPWRVAP